MGHFSFNSKVGFNQLGGCLKKSDMLKWLVAKANRDRDRKIYDR